MHLNIKDRMLNWGKFGEDEGSGLLFSIGNDYEGHGPAMPKDTDSKIAKFLCHQLERRCGLRYAAHIPLQTDGLASLALNWSPNYLPIDECARKTLDFIEYYLDLLSNTLPRIDYVIIINGHGGNRELGEYLTSPRIPVPIHYFFAVNLDLPQIVEHMEKSADYSVTPAKKAEYLAVRPGHACSFEHSIGHALGFVSEREVSDLNDELAKDFYGTLQKYPVLGGLGGYLEFGGEEFQIMRESKPNLRACYEKFKSDEKIILYPELARAAIEFTIESFVAKIRNL